MPSSAHRATTTSPTLRNSLEITGDPTHVRCGTNRTRQRCRTRDLGPAAAAVVAVAAVREIVAGFVVVAAVEGPLPC